MPEQRRDILATSPDDLARWLHERGEPAYRLAQILEWIFRRGVESFQTMTSLPLELRRALDDGFALPSLRCAGRRRSDDGATEKFLFELGDGGRIESVRLSDGGRCTFCISSQAGCALGCRFCATGAMGPGRNLSTGEILGQVAALRRAAGALRNVVFMGMGEPLLNLDAVSASLEALTDPRRFALGARRITVSTAGVTPGIRRLAEAPAPPNLALSLNTPFDDQRSELMPVNRKYPLSEVLEACREYAARTGRRLLFEYVLIGGLNTSAKAARALGRLARDLHALVNLIALNPVAGCDYAPPTRAEIAEFRSILESEHVGVTQRFRRGSEIAAGCGQLAGGHRDR